MRPAIFTVHAELGTSTHGLRRLREARSPSSTVLGALAATTTASAMARAHAFVECVAELPVAEWLEAGDAIAGDAIAGDGALLPVRQQVWLALEAAIGDHGLGLQAWRVRDGVETAVCLVTRDASCWTAKTRRLFASAHAAAEAAALALLARDHLSKEAFATLTKPFARLFAA